MRSGLRDDGVNSARGTRWSLTLWQGLVLIVGPALVLIGIESYQVARNVPELRRSQDLVAHTIEVTQVANALERAVQDAERGQRGFLITGDPEYLQPYRAGVQKVPEALARLRQLTLDDPEQQRRWPILEKQLGLKLDELARTIAARQNQGFDAARQIVDTNVGADAMVTIDQIIDGAIATEDDLLRKRVALGEAAERDTAAVSLVGTGVALVAIALGCFLVVSSFGRISASELALAASEERFRLLVSGLEDYAIYMLDPDGRVILWNDGAQRLKGYRSEEIIGRHFSCFYETEEIRSGTPERELEAARTAGSVSSEGWRRRKDGSRFFANLLITAIRDEKGTLLGFAKLTHDATQRRQAAEALTRETEQRQRAEAMFRQAQKMEVLGSLTGGIAHDFNNMLAVIVGSLELLEQRLQTADPKIRNLIRSAAQAADRSTALTNALLAYSRQQALEPRSIDVNRLFTGMSGLLNQTLGEGIAIETVLGAGVWTIAADVNQLESALLNLAVNARDAMPGSGKLTIETANAHIDEAYAEAHEEVMPGQYVMIAVTDTGIGMSEETIERAFEPFFTTKQPGEGTGLGLSQVYGFVKQSSGHIKIYSELSQGTTIKLYLPRVEASSDTTEELKIKPVMAQSRSETILVVEDNDLLLASVATMLRDQGYRVLTAANGASGLQVLDSNADVRLLFTDVVLPGGMDGRQLADEARRRYPNLLVLFTTGYTRNAIIHQGRLDSGVELIVKPFTYAALGARIQRLLDVAALEAGS